MTEYVTVIQYYNYFTKKLSIFAPTMQITANFDVKK